MRSILAGGRSGLRIAVRGVSSILACALCLVAAPSARASDCGATVRVLLERSAGPVEVEAAGHPHRIEVDAPGLRVDGRPVGPVWRSPEREAWRVGALQVGGVLEARRTERGLMIVNEVGLEDYVAGALGGEIPALWAPQALRAQAVVSRTYALHESLARRGAPYDVKADTHSQVYVGKVAAPSIAEAVAGTRCEFLSQRGEPILAVFHSASGGRTASADEVWGRPLGYLVSVEVDDEDDSPDTYWRTRIEASTLGRVLAAAGHPLDEVEDARVLSRTESGRVARIRLDGTFRGRAGTVTLSGRALRSAVGESTLRSTLFDVKRVDDALVFVGSGRGHGVGMSQWGARAMALDGRDYREILDQFYPGTRIERWRPKATDARRVAGAEARTDGVGLRRRTAGGPARSGETDETERESQL
jgi:stage II sporulation protein D